MMGMYAICRCYSRLILDQWEVCMVLMSFNIKKIFYKKNDQEAQQICSVVDAAQNAMSKTF